MKAAYDWTDSCCDDVIVARILVITIAVEYVTKFAIAESSVGKSKVRLEKKTEETCRRW